MIQISIHNIIQYYINWSSFLRYFINSITGPLFEYVAYVFGITIIIIQTAMNGFKKKNQIKIVHNSHFSLVTLSVRTP